MNMKNCNLDDKNDDVCEVFDSHEDVVNRIKGRIPDEDEFSQLSDFFKIPQYRKKSNFYVFVIFVKHLI